MTHRSGAPAALQPDDTAELERWRGWLATFDEQFWTEHKAGTYTAPRMDEDAPARAGEWLGARVYHDRAHEYGTVVGIDARGLFWVEIALDGKPARPMLIRGDALTLATPEFVARQEAERQRIVALMTPGKADWLAAQHSTKQREYPAEQGRRRCAKCGQTKPVSEFPPDTSRGTRVYSCRDCDNRRRRENRARGRVQPAGMRRCQACGEVLPLSEFRTDSNRAEGKAYECRECYNRRMNAYYHRKRYGLSAKGAE